MATIRKITREISELFKSNGVVTDRAEMRKISQKIQWSKNYKPCGK